MHERSEKLLLARRSFNAHSPSACRNSYEAGTPEFFLSSSSSSAMRNANWSKGLVKGDIEAIRDDYYFKCTLNPGKCQAKFRFEHVLKKHMEEKCDYRIITCEDCKVGYAFKYQASHFKVCPCRIRIKKHIVPNKQSTQELLVDLFEILQAEDAPKLGAEQMRRLFTAMTGKDTSFAQAKFQISRADLNHDRALSLSEWSSFSQPLLEVPNQNVVRKCLGDMLEKLRARKQHEANAKAVYVPDEAAAGDAESEESSDWGEEGDT